MKTLLMVVAIAAALIMLVPGVAFAHCDTMNGPVVKAAQKALETGNVNLVLVWIQKKDEVEIKKAFERTLAVRKLSPLAKDMADMYFFETLVRIHREGEGEPYTGLKPADTEVEPGIAMADQAVDKGSAEELVKNLNETVEKSLHTLFAAVKEKKGYKQDNVDAGREYVGAYVTFIHYVEQLYQSAQKPSAEHAHQEHEAVVHQH
jgi:hypothetical protein